MRPVSARSGHDPRLSNGAFWPPLMLHFGTFLCPDGIRDARCLAFRLTAALLPPVPATGTSPTTSKQAQGQGIGLLGLAHPTHLKVHEFRCFTTG